MNSPQDSIGDFRIIRTGGGLEVFLLPTKKLKTRLIRLHFQAPLDGRAGARALVPNILRRGTEGLPGMLEISRQLEEWYGASCGASIYKIADRHVLAFRAEYVEERFLPGSPTIEAPFLRFYKEMMLRPRLIEGCFLQDFFEQERLNHKREIQAQYNDKLRYASQRLVEEMFPGQAYGRPVLGTVEEIDHLSAASATQAWRDFRGENARLYAVGDFAANDLLEFASGLPFLSRGPSLLRQCEKPVSVDHPRLVVEPDDVSQTKLLMGYRVDLTGIDLRAYDALRYCANVLGGGFHSRLFQTVREKNGLAYYASASLDRLQGVLIVSCGIDAAERVRVCDLVEQEIRSLRSALPSIEEFEQARQLLTSGTRSLVDSPHSMVEAVEGVVASGFPRSLEEMVDSLKSMRREDVAEVACRIGPLDTVYCLEGRSLHGST